MREKDVCPMKGRFVWALCWGVARKRVRGAWGEEAGWWTESWEREQGEGAGRLWVRRDPENLKFRLSMSLQELEG